MVASLWGIAAEVLRDLFKPGKYPDVIPPVCVTRRIDAVLESTKKVREAASRLPDEPLCSDGPSPEVNDEMIDEGAVVE